MSFEAAPSTPECAPDSAPDSTPESAIAGMLAVLRVMASLFVERFGDPAALIKGGAIFGKTRERMLRFLHDMECVVRRLLLLRAALYPAPAPRPIRPLGKKIMRRRTEGDAVALFGPNDDPAQWRVTFRMPAPPEPTWIYARELGGFRAPADTYVLGHRVEPGQMAPAPKGAVSLASIGYWADDPRPLAERFEALQRVIQDPDHYAARLAERLHFWRGRAERRALFLDGLSAAAPIANEAGLLDEDWAPFADARMLLQTLIAVFSAVCAAAPMLCDSS